ncbi:MAG TPA: bifunctional 4-hydroxy-2-oxoglutarate aldolase/2-dehydro-3-deoxy-phosphogluconate aldolase [Longimicrobiales bacterium]|nr:bifunctional 4-hydroxy-2-oxoglutarate aldolase/2-dehydro-3-deoxy-phosphogluconate aldolase [Longimicrobiales bacterium]
MSEILERLRRTRVVPVIVIDDAADAVPLARALLEGGLPCAEVTFRTAAAAEAIRRIVAEVPDMLVGAGTVLTPQQAAEAERAGARFVVAPGFGPAVVDRCLERDVPVFPGVCTPTEIEMALARGLRVVKFFPAEAAGGLAFLKAVAAPYGMMEFVPTGGINAANLGAYLAFKPVVACGGSWMAPAEWIRAGDFDRIRAETRAAARAAGLAAAEA